MQSAYSFLIGLRNTIFGFAAFGIGLYLMAHPELANQGIVDYLASHLKPIIGTLTVGGFVNLIVDYFHQKWNIKSAMRQASANAAAKAASKVQ